MRARDVPEDEVATPGVLTANDRCDRCGSQAYVQVALPHGTLLFCAHHYQQHESLLSPLATAVRDERDRLHAVS